MGRSANVHLSICQMFAFEFLIKDKTNNKVIKKVIDLSVCNVTSKDYEVIDIVKYEYICLCGTPP